MKLSFLLPLCFLACTSLPGSQPSTECLGAESASNMIVYLHGMDIPAKSAQEIQNREKLLRIASKTNSRVALPRALRRCPGTVDQICWGWSFNDNELADIKQSIQSAATQCGAPPHYVIVGFSNGGYGINRLFEKCLLTADQKMISIGAAALPYRDESSDLAKCGSLKLIVGKHDQYNKREANKYADNLKARHANVELIEFDGAHEIPEQVLLDNLKSE